MNRDRYPQPCQGRLNANNVAYMGGKRVLGYNLTVFFDIFGMTRRTGVNVKANFAIRAILGSDTDDQSTAPGT
jgi:hypothetical protein